MTRLSFGWNMVRDAARSLATTLPAIRHFANPRQMMPDTYIYSLITALTTAQGKPPNSRRRFRCFAAALGDGIASKFR
jgi:hypothetical protein